MTWTHTSRGRALDLLDPQPDDIDLDEIALALGNQCRYAGCVREFYSVAEHSVLVAEWLRKQGHPVDVQLAGLLHDAAEAYTGDITWPMQAVLFADAWPGLPPTNAGDIMRGRYRAVQRALDDLICERVGLDPALLHCEPVKSADLRILLDERRVLLTEPPPRPWPIEEAGYEPLGVSIRCNPPQLAATLWSAWLDSLLADRLRAPTTMPPAPDRERQP